MKKIIIVCLLIVLILSMGSVAFAAGNRADFYGTYDYGFQSSDYVSQKNDTKIIVTNDETYLKRGSDTMHNYAAFRINNSNGSSAVDAQHVIGVGGAKEYTVSKWDKVRSLHVYVANIKDNTTRYTRGHAMLYAY